MEIIENSTFKKLTILKMLKNNKHLSVNEMSSLSNISKNTIYKYISEFKYRISTLSKIEETLNFDIEVSYRHLEIDVISEDINIKLFKTFLLRNEVNIFEFTINNFISEGSFRRKINIIRKAIRDYNFTIKTQNNISKLCGDENSIRILAQKFFWSLYKGEKWIFEELDKNKLVTILSNIIPKQVMTETNFVSINQAVNAIAITIIRSRKGYSPVISKELNIEDRWFKENIWPKISSHVTIPYTDALYIFLSFISAPRFILSPLGNKLSKTLFDLNSTASLVSTDFCNELQKVMDGYLIDSIHLYNLIYSCHVFHFLYYNWASFKNTDPYLNNYPELKKRLTTIKNKVFERYEIKLYSLNTSYSLLKNYQLIFGQYYPLSFFEKEIIIFLNTDLGLLYENILKKELTDSFSHIYNIKIFIASSHIQSSKIDLVITTNNDSLLNELYGNSEYIYIEEFPSPIDFFNIRKIINDIYIRKK